MENKALLQNLSVEKSCSRKAAELECIDVTRNRDVEYNESTPPTSELNNCIENDETEKSVIICFGCTKRQLKVFLSLIFVSLNEVMAYSAIAPFFPIVAKNKGLSAASYGLIFASFSVFGLISALLTGTALVKVGAKFCVLSGMFWNAGANFLFGFLNKTATTPFLILAFFCRGLMGFASVCAYTAVFAITFQEFNTRAVTVLSLSESLIGVGMMVAPVVGGGLYDLGGFIAPFLFLGFLQVSLFVACWYMLPDVPVQDRSIYRPPPYLLTHSSAFTATIINTYVFIVASFTTANIGPFLSLEFQVNSTIIGVVFLVIGLFYAGMSPIWGYLIDRWQFAFLVELGTLGLAVGLAFTGPAMQLRRWFGWQHQRMWLIYVSTAILGMSFGAALMSTFNEIATAAKELQLGDTPLAQYGLVAGLVNMAFSVGDILGPSLGGELVKQFGFPNAAAILALVGVSLMFLKLLQRIYRFKTSHRRKLKNEEAIPLTKSDNDRVVD